MNNNKPLGHKSYSSIPHHHHALDPVEGLIYRVERKGEVDFLTKYVRHDKVDGKYLPENNGTGEPIWNIDITPYL